MSGFWKDAVAVFETASNAAGRDVPSDVAILVERSGGLRIVAAEGWSAEGLEAHYGAQAVYHVSRSAQRVSVRGRGDGMSCLLEGPGPAPLRAPVSVPLYAVETRKMLA